jgi:hypothetical protein
VLRLLALVVAVAALTASVYLVEAAPAKVTVQYRAVRGAERWSVKTLTDRAARRINFRPRTTTVSTLRRLRSTGSSTRGYGVERRARTRREMLRVCTPLVL